MLEQARTPAPATGNKFNVTPMVEGFVVKPIEITQAISISGTLIPFEETVLMPEYRSGDSATSRKAGLSNRETAACKVGSTTICRQA